MPVLKKPKLISQKLDLTKHQLIQWFILLNVGLVLLIISLGWGWYDQPILQPFYSTLIAVSFGLISKLVGFWSVNQIQASFKLLPIKPELNRLTRIRWQIFLSQIISIFLSIAGLLIALITNLATQKVIFNLIFLAIATLLMTIVNFLAVLMGVYYQSQYQF